MRKGSKDEIKAGYWLIEILGVEVKGERLIPLLTELYSQKVRDFESENTQIFKALDSVRIMTKGKGIWAMDRGGDRKRFVGG